MSVANDPQLREALQLIAETVGARAEPYPGNRFRLLTLEPEGVRRVSILSHTALLHLAGRIRAHQDWLDAAHFYDLWNRSTKFRL